MRSRLNRDKTELMKRLAAMLVAVVFALGTVLIPSDIYAVETDDQEAAAAEAAEPEAAAGDEAVDEEAAEPETEVQEDSPAAEVSGSGGDLTDLLVVNDEDGNRIDLEDLDEDQYDGFIYKMKDDTTNAEINEMEEAIDGLDKGREAEEVFDREFYSADSIETIEDVAPAEQVQFIEPNYVRTICETPNDPLYENNSWQLEVSNIPYIWDMGMTGKGATVAVIDSGVNVNHVDLEGVDFVSPYNVISGNTDVTDRKKHGTGVAGVIAETRNNDTLFAGALSEVSIMPVKATNDDGNTSDRYLMLAMQYAVNNNADVINMSIGADTPSNNLELACEAVAEKGVIIVAPSGNEAEEGNPYEYPASYDCVISVGSVDWNEERSHFSNYNDKLTVVAPGNGVYILSGTDKCLLSQGTSFSTPQVSALAAMIRSYDDGVDVREFIDILEATSKDLGDPGYDIHYGYGLIDYAAVLRNMATKLSNCSMKLSAKTYDFDGTVKSPVPTVSLSKYKLKKGENYTVSYSGGRKAVGTYKATVTGVNGTTGTLTSNFTIRPPLVKAIKAPKRLKKKLTVRWYAMTKSQKKKYGSAITGYQVRVSTSPDFSIVKWGKVKGANKTKVTVKGLKRKTIYYVQYRSYKNVGGTIYYSKWSGTKKVRTK
ncbi:MAG: S8 family serine peptidase [Bacillota bacterium]